MPQTLPTSSVQNCEAPKLAVLNLDYPLVIKIRNANPADVPNGEPARRRVDLVDWKVEDQHRKRRSAWPARSSPGNGHTIILVRMKLNDGDPDKYCSEACVFANMWTGSLSVRQAFIEASYGAVDFDQSNSAIVQVTINKSVADYGCDAGMIEADCAAAVDAQTGYTYTNFTFRSIYQPKGIDCAWGGLGNVHGPQTWIRGHQAGILVHELGHNLGMYHAGTDLGDDGTTDYTCKHFGTSATPELTSPTAVV